MDRQSKALELMLDFAGRTGLSDRDVPPRRYLWTDAFGVCNFLGLFEETGDERLRELAVVLIDQVHHVLGRYRDDDPRTGWISGLDEEEGEAHPTIGGLRIGKPLPERRPDEAFDEELEWNRDGQYFHYLTQWMHALERAARVVGEPRYHRQAVELAKAAHHGFTVRTQSGTPSRMVWKMSTDLQRPLVASMGQHDPISAYVTYSILQSNGVADPDLDLTREIDEMATLCSSQDLRTSDSLGLGGLLSDACRLSQLAVRGQIEQVPWVARLLASAVPGLARFVASPWQKQPATYRLAFRECGLSIGLHGVERIASLLETSPLPMDAKQDLEPLVSRLLLFRHVAREVEDFWLDPVHRANATWEGHDAINQVMLATSLAPRGYLTV